MRIGAHVPVSDGLPATVDYALLTGCETIQVFAKSPQRWVGTKRDPREAAEFIAACAHSDLMPVFTHAGYLINVGADDADLWDRSWIALGDEFARAAALGATGVVVHLGRRFADDDAACVARIVEAVARALDVAGPSAPMLLIENSAGAGRQFGSAPREMALALNAVREAGYPAALCFDTCHGLAAGIDITCAAGWTSLMDCLDESAGPHAIALVHANDCQGRLGSHLDRHAWIGEGSIGEGGFAAMLSEPRLARTPAIVEMSGDKPVKDSVNVSRLKRLRDAVAGSDAPTQGLA